jgi:hypothetical protein
MARGMPAILDHLLAQHAAADAPAADRPFTPALLLGPRMDSYRTNTLEAFQAWTAAD